MEFLPKQNFTYMKTTLTFIFLLGITTVFAQSTASTSTPNSGTDKSKTGFGPKTDTRNPFDTTKVKGKPQMKNGISGWGDVGVAPKENSYVGETEKNKKPATNNLGGEDDPFGKNKPKKNQKLSDGDDPFSKTKPKNTQNVIDGDDPFGKTKSKNTQNVIDGDDPFGKTNSKKNAKLIDGDDPFEKSKKNSATKKKSSYANQEVSY